MAFRPGDSKREEFRKYLEKAGVLDALTKALVNLYEEPEKPADALEYLKENLKLTPELVAMKQEMEELKQKVEQLTLENSQLKEKGLKYENTEEWPSIPDAQQN